MRRRCRKTRLGVSYGFAHIIHLRRVMLKSMSGTRQHAHELIDRMPEAQVSALVGLLETMVDPAIEDEEISDEEGRAVARSKEWFRHNEGIPFEQVVAELGFTMEQIRCNKEHP
jgi:hypothetical protein